MTMHITSLFVCLFFVRGMGMTIPAPNFYYNLIGGVVLPIYHGKGGRAGGGEFFGSEEKERE